MRRMLDDGVELLRRYDPTADHHMLIDQLDGSKRFPSSIWHDSGASPDSEYSVFDHGLLIEKGVNPVACLERNYTGLASLKVRDVRACRGANLGAEHLDALSDPLENKPPRATDFAHAIVWLSREVQGSRRRTLLRALATRLTPMTLG